MQLAHSIMNIPTVGDDRFLPFEGKCVRQGQDLPSLCRLMRPLDRSGLCASGIGDEAPAGSWPDDGLSAAPIRSDHDVGVVILWEVELVVLCHLDALWGFAISSRYTTCVTKAVREEAWSRWSSRHTRTFIDIVCPPRGRCEAHGARSCLRFAPATMGSPWGIDRVRLHHVQEGGLLWL